jgi:hypothetical protein
MLKKIDWKKILEIVSRWYVFVFLNLYGIGKIMGGQFYRKGKLPEEIASLTLEQASGYDIAWTFMGYSYAYILFVGISQIIGAWLLLWNKTKLLGVAILFPIMINIVVFDVIFLDVKDAVVNAVIYLLMLVYILFYNKEKVNTAYQSFTTLPVKNKLDKKQLVKRIGLVLVVMAIIFAIDQFFVNLMRDW